MNVILAIMTPVQNVPQQEHKLIQASVQRVQLFIYWEMTREKTTVVLLLEPFFFLAVQNSWEISTWKVSKIGVRASGWHRNGKLQCRDHVVASVLLNENAEEDKVSRMKAGCGSSSLHTEYKWSAVTPVFLYCSPVDMLVIRCMYFFTAVLRLSAILPVSY